VTGDTVTAGGPTRSERRHRYRGDIQAMRGLAVLVVVMFHAGFGLHGGFVGVDVFFVISGFVITGVIERQLASTGKLGFSDFYSRRVRRLLPALALMTIVVLAVSILVLSPTGPQQNAAKTGAAASVFSANVYLYRYGVDYFHPANVNPFLHTWSLAVEEQTYLMLPITLVALWAIGRRLGRSRVVAVVGIVAASLFSFGLSVILTSGSRSLHIPLPVKFAFFSPFTRLWEFGFGVVLALVAHRLPRRSGLGVALGLVGLALVLYACVTFDGSTPFPGSIALVPVAGAALMIAAGCLSERWRGTAAIAPMVWLGGLSYAWYLWHWPFIVFAKVLWPSSDPAVGAAVVVSLLVAVVSRDLLENRFRYDRRVVGRRAIAFTAVCVAVPLVVAVAVVAGGNRGWGNDELAQRVAESTRSRAENDGCDSILRTSPCVYPGGGNATVALVGDSHAGAISDAVMDSVHAASDDLEVWTRPGCPFLVGVAKTKGDDCEIWSNQVFTWFQQNPPDVLIVHVDAENLGVAGALENADGVRAGTDEEATGLYVDGLAAVARALAPLGTRMVVVADVPSFPTSAVETASLLHPNPTPSSRSRREVDQGAERMDRALAGLAASTGATVVDPKPVLCTPTRCSQYAGGWQYRDNNHLTRFGATKLTGPIDAAIAGSGASAASGTKTLP